MDDVQRVTTAPASPPVRQPIDYDGRAGELYAIFVHNILLSVITLGIYRFWGRTRFRRYLWSHTAFQGDRFEYTGTGGELFRGFVIAFVIFMLAVSGLVALQFTVAQSHPFLAAVLLFGFYAVLGFLLFVARYTALRYRLTRTRWRAIRFGLAGSAFNFALLNIAMLMLNGATLLLFSPVATLRLWEYRLDNAWFGTARVAFAATARPLYGRFVAWWFGKIFLFGLGIAALLVSAYVAYAVSPTLQGSAGDFDPDTFVASLEALLQTPGLWRELIPAGLVLAAAFLLLLAANWWLDCFYGALLIRHIAGGVQLAGLRTGATLATGSFFGLAIGNLLLLLTLGLAYPLVLHRVWRFAAANVVATGTLDGAGIAQNEQFVPRRGEGFLNVLDPGGV